MIWTCETAHGFEVWSWPDLPLCIARRLAEQRAKVVSRGHGYCLKRWAYRASTGRDECVETDIVV